MNERGFDVVVIGGGPNGLTAAAVLGRAGLRVVLVDGGEALGGLGRVIEFAPGFKAAPLGLDSGWLPPAVAQALDLHTTGDPDLGASLAVPVSNGEFLVLPSDVARAADAIRPLSAGDASKWPAFTARLHRLAGFLAALYQTPAPDIDARSLDELLPLLGIGRRFRGLGRVDMIEFLRTLPMSVWELLDDWFECGPLKAAVAAGGVQDIQQGPRSGGTGFVLLHHLVGAAQGSVRARAGWPGGPAAFAKAAGAAALRCGVTVRTGAPVSMVRVEDDRTTGVVLDGGEAIAAGAVLSTTNPAGTLLDLVDPVWLDPEFVHAVRNIRHRGCTSVVVFALGHLPEAPGLPREALAGVVSLTPSLEALERAADAAKYGEVPDTPHVEVTVPTLRNPRLAPADRHVMIARVQYAPYRLRPGTTWDAERREALADTATKAIAGVIPGFASAIEHRVAWSPRDLEERFGLREGAVSHGELGLDQILFMRPVAGWGRHATPIDGLYLGGAGTHPGPGVLGGPGWLAARRLLAERGRRKERA
jgi:phytoene dehydrogenase-like protein